MWRRTEDADGMSVMRGDDGGREVNASTASGALGQWGEGSEQARECEEEGDLMWVRVWARERERERRGLISSTHGAAVRGGRVPRGRGGSAFSCCRRRTKG